MPSRFAASPSPETPLAVFDVETTGFAAGGRDRIIEIAIVLASRGGERMAEYSTLVNPLRDTGPSHVHGIHGADVEVAPLFGEVAGDIVELMRDAVLVGHNVSFDMRFLRAEFTRAGHPLPAIWTLCTVSMARHLGKQAPRTLSACCDHFGIDLAHHHNALDDVHATTDLLFHGLERGCEVDELARRTPPCDGSVAGWPQLATGDAALSRARGY